jgi:hypothetical protein
MAGDGKHGLIKPVARPLRCNMGEFLSAPAPVRLLPTGVAAVAQRAAEPASLAPHTAQLLGLRLAFGTLSTTCDSTTKVRSTTTGACCVSSPRKIAASKLTRRLPRHCSCSSGSERCATRQPPGRTATQRIEPQVPFVMEGHHRRGFLFDGNLIPMSLIGLRICPTWAG